jgi:hypothetical protein
MTTATNIRNFEVNFELMTVSAVKAVLLKSAPVGNAIPRSREYFRLLRAAEMAAWEMTGGDYVSSDLLAEAA